MYQMLEKELNVEDAIEAIIVDDYEEKNMKNKAVIAGNEVFVFQ